MEKVKKDYKKSELTAFAKTLAYAHFQYLNTMCIAEEVSVSDIGKKFRCGDNDKLLVEIAKRYAKYVRNECSVDLENGAIQNCQNIINDIVACCEENNWFK